MDSPAAADGAAEAAASIRIVGIGASAGGLVALEQFLAPIPRNSGMAYIVVQHLDPTQRALLPELLQRATKMPVHEAQQDMRVERNCVYVIPPNAELSVVDGTLHLARPSEPRGMRLPINVLFSSLAKAQGEDAIAVVLSGMGTDGTLGLQAIKAVAGLTLVQAPDSAQFDSMPRSAIAANCADIVAPPGELPAHILASVAKVSGPDTTEEQKPAEAAAAPLERVVNLLQTHTGHDFSLYKNSTLHRRIERRMTIHKIASMALYAEFIEHNAQELDLLFNELLIGVTSFFRDPKVWEYLAQVAIPDLLARREPKHPLRAWVVGCSTGEEAYSLAMVFREAARRVTSADEFRLQIFASDLSQDAIATARRGSYPLSIDANVSADRLARYFVRHENHYQIDARIRDMVLFAKHDVMLDPPFTKLDLIACRNLLIYFDPRLQRRLLPLFHYCLRPGGLLQLGSAETVGQLDYLFVPVVSRLRLYLRQDDVSVRDPHFTLNAFPQIYRPTKEHHVSPPSPPSHPPDSLQAAADEVLLQVYAPAAVVLNRDADIVYISGRTGKYLEPAAGKANWNFYSMVRDSLRVPLTDALKRVSARIEPLHLHGLRVELPGDTQQSVDVTVHAFREPAALRDMTMVVFRDVAAIPTGRGKAKGARDAAHEAEVQQLRHEIEILNDQARASGEELQSANEELQSTNEELQSTNEELTTSKEEMQSMNEELQTINVELQTKLDDLSLAQSDMQNVLNSIEIAILFLDQNLHVRRYTDRAAKIINLRESDVGRPLSDLTTTLQYAGLHEDALETLRTLVFTEKEVLADDGRWFAVRIMPYRRLDNVIDGVVITLVDITATKKLESTLRQEAGH
ncbi:MAG: chemotaxis protein CheB [Gammaproteobacteria bacterium]|nr:chemotaxis protein CheB [Gammaproteobacteria bacterium]